VLDITPIPLICQGGNPEAGLPEYTKTIIDAIESCAEPVAVAQSMGGFSAVMACDRVPVAGLILVGGHRRDHGSHRRR
jgi:hypothetical protein